MFKPAAARSSHALNQTGRHRLQLELICAFATALCAAPSFAQAFDRTPLPDSHPFIGQWRFDIPQLNCYEEYHVRKDGTLLVISGQERNESEFPVALYPSANGYYRWTDRILRNNGKPDCSGSLTPVGHVATNFLLFHRDRNSFLLCAKEDMATCFGPYVRKKASDA